jgi:hypothetical protein
MTKKRYGTTASGKPITDELVAELAAKAQVGYDCTKAECRQLARAPPSMTGH